LVSAWGELVVAEVGCDLEGIGGADIMAGWAGIWEEGLCDLSAMAARYARFDWSRRIHLHIISFRSMKQMRMDVLKIFS